ncbi:MAG: class I SAM-dependent methyltransferase [Chlorobiaceae bacterium]|jgi:SAM-dependent methyltransferase|nr:class I SAM-dependent methyltransferase [Chlorobiaceae bacterium]NTV16856.1 class I SAM-dependent methyltransferase [Chlorobiaceae bacterium]
MLQLKKAGLKALDNLRSEGVFPSSWQSMGELESKTDEFILRFLAERFRVSRELGGFFFLPELLDRVMRTSEIEHMDDQRLPETEKLEMVRALDRQNQMLHLYPRYVGMLFSIIEEVAQGEQQEVSVLELASGSGGLALAMAEEAQRKNLPLSITGSDIVPIFIEEGNRQAEEKKLPVSFRLLNAFALPEFSAGSFDLMLLSQSIHHFTPGQLAIMIAQSAKHTKTAFVGIDGYRSILLAGGVPLMASMQGIASFALDGLISARKFYSELELDIIAEIATGKKNHIVTSSWPLSILTVRFDGVKPVAFRSF